MPPGTPCPLQPWVWLLCGQERTLTFQIPDEGDGLDGVAAVGEGLHHVVLHEAQHAEAALVTCTGEGRSSHVSAPPRPTAPPPHGPTRHPALAAHLGELPPGPLEPLTKKSSKTDLQNEAWNNVSATI